MEGRLGSQYFLEPQETFHRRYEALRAVFVDGEPLHRVAPRSGYKVAALESMACRFRAECRRGISPPLFLPDGRGRPPRPCGGQDHHGPELPEVADRRRLSLAPGPTLRTRVAGIFLSLPSLTELGFDRLVAQARYPGSTMVPALAASLAPLTLKLLDKGRRSHMGDFNFDEALGLFAGLNLLPKKSVATDFSYRTGRDPQPILVPGWVRALAPLMFPDASGFSLDSHPIPYRGEPSGLDRHYLPRRGVAGPSVLSFFALEQKSRCRCYPNADLTRADQDGELMRFVASWHTVTETDPPWLYFDSKLIDYPEMSRVNQRQIPFITIRRRGRRSSAPWNDDSPPTGRRR